MDFHLNDLFVLRYPDDFMQLKFFRNGKNSQNLVLPTILDLKDPFMFETEIAFDVHMADFDMQLILYDANGAESATEEDPADFGIVAHSSPLVDLEDNDDETFLRVIPQHHINPHDEDAHGLKYMLSIEEKQAFFLFNEVSKSEGVRDLCLPFIFKMRVEKDDKHHGAVNLHQLIND